MTIRIVQLGSPRAQSEGLRVGTVRRPPRGVPKAEFSRRDYYDVWYPELSPSAELMALGQAAQKNGDAKDWQQFEKAFRKAMAEAPAARTLDLLAALHRCVPLSRAPNDRCGPKRNHRPTAPACLPWPTIGCNGANGSAKAHFRHAVDRHQFPMGENR